MGHQRRRHHPYRSAEEPGVTFPAAHVDGTEHVAVANLVAAGQLLSFRPGGPRLAMDFAAPQAVRAEQQHRAPVFAPPPHPCPFSSSDGVPMAPLVAGEPSGRRVVERDGTQNVNVSCLPLAREAGCRVLAASAAGVNFVVSPLSFHAALALVAAGTRGETRRELLDLLGSPSFAELNRAAATRLVRRLRDDISQTSFACGVWVQRGRDLTPEFADAAASRYGAVAEPADFAAGEQARRRVNSFISDATRGLITDVLPPGAVGPDTVVVLANAVYFKGTWSLPFHPPATFHAPFHLLDGAAVIAPFMTTTAPIPLDRHVAAFPGFTALKLPYKNDGEHQATFYMLILLPDSGNGGLELADLYDMAVTTPDFIKRHTPAARVPVRRLMVPKFKFSYKFEASPDMRKLGVTRAFVNGDFSGMVTGGGEGLFIAGVYHHATIEVDEVGTVAAAAAATAVVIQQCASARPPVDFVADRPFLFAVVEEITGAVLSLGHVVNPLAE